MQTICLYYFQCEFKYVVPVFRVNKELKTFVYFEAPINYKLSSHLSAFKGRALGNTNYISEFLEKSMSM